MGDEVLAFTGAKALEQGTRARFQEVFSVFSALSNLSWFAASCAECFLHFRQDC
jgi:hypothetical protein